MQQVKDKSGDRSSGRSRPHARHEMMQALEREERVNANEGL